MVDTPKLDELPMLTRITLLEAKVRLIVIVIKSFVGVIVMALLGYFFGVHL
jgi:hypothetical protein